MAEAQTLDYTKKRDMLDIMWKELDLEVSSFTTHWKQLGDFILPVRPRFYVTDANKGTRKNTYIIDSTASKAADTLASGMMGGITSPARPWFRLTTPYPFLNELESVKYWLHEVTRVLSTVFLKSNLYNVFPSFYGDMGVFGMGSFMVQEDDEDVLRFIDLPIGSYRIANDKNYRIRVFMREFQKTVRQLVEEFGKVNDKGEIQNHENFSTTVLDLYKKKQFETWIKVRHAVYPNPNWRPGNPFSKFKRFADVYYECGNEKDAQVHNREKYLRESGHDRFPILTGRWKKTGEDVYATNSPGIMSLGDVKQLQAGEKMIMKAIDKMVDPPMKGPATLRQVRHSILPSDITYYDETEDGGEFKPVHEVNPRIKEMELKQQQVRSRIDNNFFVPLFLMFSTTDRREITAREVDERHEEKLLALGPVLEQLNQDVLDPLIDHAFYICLKRGLLPPPPEELEQVELKVEYISVMAQAQKMATVSAIERVAKFATDLSSLSQDPGVLDKIDMDQMIDEYADGVGTSPRIVRSDETVADIRRKRAEAEAAAAAAEKIKNATGAVKDLAGAKLGEDNALQRLIEQLNAGQRAA